MGFTNIKSTNASVPGLKPHLLGLKKERYIFFNCSSDLQSNCTFGRCSLSHCNTRFGELSTVFSLASQDFLSPRQPMKSLVNVSDYVIIKIPVT